MWDRVLAGISTWSMGGAAQAQLGLESLAHNGKLDDIFDRIGIPEDARKASGGRLAKYTPFDSYPPNPNNPA